MNNNVFLLIKMPGVEFFTILKYRLMLMSVKVRKDVDTKVRFVTPLSLHKASVLCQVISLIEVMMKTRFIHCNMSAIERLTTIGLIDMFVIFLLLKVMQTIIFPKNPNIARNERNTVKNIFCQELETLFIVETYV